MNILIGVGIFIATLLLIEGGYAVWRTFRDPNKKKLRRRLETIKFEGLGIEEQGLERQNLLSAIPWLNRMLQKFKWIQNLELFLNQAGVLHRPGLFILLSLVLAGIGYIAGSWILANILISLLFAFILGTLPFIYIFSKRKKRMDKFQRQLPEALDLMARSLRAGHAFTGGMKMVADEMDEPIGAEFDKTLAEINLGVDLQDALKNLSHRVDCPDLRFFVISIIIQRETGGNLAELLENISYLIRERFKLHGRIRVLAAEGKFSAIILVALPFLVATVLTILNRGYIKILLTDPLGNIMVGFALLMMILGIFVMKKLVVIKV